MLIKYQKHNILLDGDFIKIPKPITIRINEIDEETTKKFFEDFQKALDTGQNIIPIIIDSYGGDIYSIFAMADCIKSSSIPVMTICNGKSISAGAVMLTCGHEGLRYISPLSAIMLHDASAFFEGKVEDMKVSIREMNRVNSQLYKILDDNCGQKSGFFKDKIKKLKNVDYWISAEKALEYNIVNHVGIPDLTYEVNYGFNLRNEKEII